MGKDPLFSHYFTNTPVKSEPRELTFSLDGITLSLTSDEGVFSKSQVDYGTMTLLQSITARNPQSILDLGCGYGVVGCFLALKYPRAQVTLSDISERAIHLSQLNAEKAHLTNTTTILSDGFKSFPPVLYDLIVFNPPVRAGKATMFGLIKDAIDHLSPHGQLYLVNRRDQGADSTKKFIAQQPTNIELINRQRGYFVFKVSHSLTAN